MVQRWVDQAGNTGFTWNVASMTAGLPGCSGSVHWTLGSLFCSDIWCVAESMARFLGLFPDLLLVTQLHIILIPIIGLR